MLRALNIHARAEEITRELMVPLLLLRLLLFLGLQSPAPSSKSSGDLTPAKQVFRFRKVGVRHGVQNSGVA